MGSELNDRPVADATLGYARRGSARSRYRLVVPLHLAITSASTAGLLAIVGLFWLDSHLAERSYDPAWYRWVAPLAVVAAIPFIAIGFFSTDPSGRRGAKFFAVAASLPVALCAAGILFGPRIVVCGESASRVKCAAHLKTIGQALMVYSIDNGGGLPDNFYRLVMGSEVPLSVFGCPDSNVHITDRMDRLITAQNVMVPQFSSYTYYGSGLSWPCAPNAVLAVEHTPHAEDGGGNVLWGDGRVEYGTPQQMSKILAELRSGHNPPRPEMIR